MKKHSLLFLWALLLTATVPLLGQGNDPLFSPVTKTYAIKNVNIVQKPGQLIALGTVIIKNGLIQEVGKDVKIPSDAKVISADSMYVYAGFIDGLSHTGIARPEPAQGQGGGGQGRPGQAQQTAVDVGNPPNEVAGILPERQVKDVLNPKDKSIEELRKAGFATAHVVPRGNMLPGTGAIVLLHGDSPDKMILRNQTSFFSQLTGAGRVYPSTVIGVMSKWRELYKRAEQAKAHEAMYAKNPAGMARPNTDRSLQAFYPVLEKKQPVFFAASDLKSMHRVLVLQNELQFSLVLANIQQGWDLADMVKTKNVPVLLALELPKEKKKDEKKKDEKADLSITDKEVELLEKRRAEEMKKYTAQAGVFEKKGIEFGFSVMNAKSTDIRENLRKMIENGLSETTALAALTTHPAKMLGLSSMMGTVEKGKIANLVITDKSYFDEKSNVRYVFVEGNLYEYEAPPAKKPGDSAATPAKIGGTWSYSVSVEGQTMEGSIEISQEGTVLSGAVSNPLTGQVAKISNPQLSGNRLIFNVTFEIDGGMVTVEYDLKIDGDTFDGLIDAGSNGSFAIEGTRKPK